MTTAPILHLENVWKAYEPASGPLQVLQGVDLHVSSRRAVAVTGPSGSGKSTLLHLIAGLLPPDQGCITVGGQDVAALQGESRDRFRARTIGILFQDHHLLPQLTALENVLLPTLPVSMPADEAQTRARELLDRLNLNGRADHFPSQLSGGEKHRVALARALINAPQLLLADEPTGALDRSTGEQIARLLRETARSGPALVVVTHADYVAACMDERFELIDGRLNPLTGEADHR